MKRIVLAAGLALLVGCGQDPQSGGGGIEIPNGLNLTVASADDKPVSGVAVRLMARESWAQRTIEGGAVVLDSGRTDSAGRISFRLPQGEGYWVEASTGGMGVRLQGDKPETRRAYLAPLSRLEGYLGAGPIAGVEVRLAGSTRRTVTDANGRFRFDSLPQSGYSMVARTGASRRLAQLGEVGIGLDPVDAQGLVNDTASVVLDNFADGDNIWLLRGLFGSGYWWLAANNPDLRAVFGTGGAWESLNTDGVDRWMQVVVDASAMPNQPWAGLGLDMGARDAVLPELSGATDIRFRVRGAGRWSLKLEEVRGDTTITWASAFDVTDSWTTVRVDTSSLAPDATPMEVWSARPRKVRQIIFQTTESGNLDVAELAIEGANLGDWKR